MSQNNNRDVVFSLEAEASILGFILTYPSALNNLENLHYYHFYSIVHQIVFKAMRSLQEDNMTCDFLGVRNHLANVGKLDEIGGISTLIQLMDVDIRSATTSPEQHASIVIEAYRIRELHDAAALLHEVTSKGTLSKNAIESLSKKIFELSSELKNNNSNIVLVEAQEAAANLVEYYYDNNPEKPYIPTGFPTLDHYLGGGGDFEEKVPGGLRKATIIVGRSGVGKTTVQVALISKIAHNYYKETGKKTVLFSLEIDEIAIASKFVSCAAGISATKIMYRGLNDDESKKFENGINYFSDLGLYLSTAKKISMGDIKNKLKENKYKEEVGLIVIDYAGLLSSPYDDHNSASYTLQAIKENLNILKEINDELGISVVLTCQATRASGDKLKTPPTIVDVATSIDYVRYAEIGIWLHVDEFNPNILKMAVMKNRYGKSSSEYNIQFEFDPGLNRLIDGSESKVINTSLNDSPSSYQTEDF